MQIQVRCGCGEAACPEWAVVEVQGVLQPQPCFSGRIQGLHIGRLCSTSSSPSSKARTTSLPCIFDFLIPGIFTVVLPTIAGRAGTPSSWGTMSSPARR